MLPRSALPMHSTLVLQQAFYFVSVTDHQYHDKIEKRTLENTVLINSFNSCFTQD